MSRRVYRVRSRPLADALRRLGARLPTFRVGGYTLALAPSNGRLYVTHGSSQIGDVLASGIWRPIKFATDQEIADILAIFDDPLNVARGAAILLGMKAQCAACGRLLDSKDRLRGIGEKCFSRGEFWRLEKGANAGENSSVRLTPAGKSRERKHITRRHGNG